MRVWLKRLLLLGVGALCGGLVGFVAGWLEPRPSGQRVDRVVAMSWNDQEEGRPSYGAHVYLEPLDDAVGYSVQAQVFIDRGDEFFSYVHGMGELGRVATDEEAVARWGTIIWRDDGVQFGSDPDAPFLSRAALRRGR